MKIMKTSGFERLSDRLDNKTVEERLEDFKKMMHNASVWTYLKSWSSFNDSMTSLMEKSQSLKDKRELTDDEKRAFFEEVDYIRGCIDFLEDTINEWKESHNKFGKKNENN